MGKTIRYQPGDVVAIPLGRGNQVYGRLYRDATLAVYRFLSCSTPQIEDLAKCDILMFASFFDTAIKNGDWKIVGRIPFPEDEEAWPPPRYVRDIINPTKVRIYERGEMRPATEEEVQGLSEFLMYKPEQLVERIKDLLQVD